MLDFGLIMKNGFSALIFIMFFYKVCGYDKRYWWQVLLVILGDLIIGYFLPPILYQIVMTLWNILIFSVSIKHGFYAFLMLFTIETPIYIVIDYFYSIPINCVDISYVVTLKLFDLIGVYILSKIFIDNTIQL